MYLFRVLQKLHNLAFKVNVIVFERPQRIHATEENKNPAGEYAEYFFTSPSFRLFLMVRPSLDSHTDKPWLPKA